jgi:hypothetical protein
MTVAAKIGATVTFFVVATIIAVGGGLLVGVTVSELTGDPALFKPVADITWAFLIAGAIGAWIKG